MKKKRKGFTLVELLVVIAIIALLMGILMPALAKVRAIAYRVVCGTNLSGLGKAMLIYANDYEDEFPQAGGVGAVWALSLQKWDADNRFDAYNLNANGTGGQVTVASSLYLLVKYSDVGPKQFLCKGTDTTEFKLLGDIDFADVWDFMDKPELYCSYSYHAAYDTPYALTTAGSQPGMAVAADRNPWLDPAVDVQARRNAFKWDGTTAQQKAGNAIAHQDDGQNVLFLDAHVAFEKRAFCGVEDDNIYTLCAKTGRRQQGATPGSGAAKPLHKEDSLLVNEGRGAASTDPDDPDDPDDPIKPLVCFLPDTLVWVDGALLQISKVIPGQKVGKPVSARVLVGLQEAVCLKEIEMVQEHDESEGPFECYDIVLETGNRISVADAHYFLVDSGRWVLAQNLTSGSKLVSLKGSISVSSVTKRATPYVGKVYNLKVKGGKRYFVGKDGVTVRDY